MTELMIALRRSPRTLLERDGHPGPGPGRLAVVMARAGVGKTAFLVGIGVDALLAGQKVLHVSVHSTVGKVRGWYDDLLAEMLRRERKLEHLALIQLEVERRRHILVYDRDSFTLDKLRNSVAFLKEASGFSPDMVIMDGTPRFDHSEAWEMEGVTALARDWQAEVWTSATLHREGQQLDSRGVPLEVARFDEHLAVVLVLATEAGRIRVRIAKDHDKAEVANVPLELDAHTLMLRWS